MVFVVKDIVVIFRKITTILILISFKRCFSHPEKSMFNLISDPGQGVSASKIFNNSLCYVCDFFSVLRQSV